LIEDGEHRGGGLGLQYREPLAPVGATAAKRRAPRAQCARRL